jgi:hypothetical protein
MSSPEAIQAPTAPRPVCDGKCVEKVAIELARIHGTPVELMLSIYIDPITGNKTKDLPPIRYEYSEGRKNKKGHFNNIHCPICGRYCGGAR